MIPHTMSFQLQPSRIPKEILCSVRMRYVQKTLRNKDPFSTHVFNSNEQEKNKKVNWKNSKKHLLNSCFGTKGLTGLSLV